MMYLITGGARSGKSSYAQKLALQFSENPVYIATAKLWDEDFQKRVERHRDDRGGEWTNIEEARHISHLGLQGKVAVIDCVTLWLANFFQDTMQSIDESLQCLKKEVDALRAIKGTFILVTNEIGMGVHAQTETGRKFTDLQGWANQYIAARSQKVVLMVSGIPVMIKE